MHMGLLCFPSPWLHYNDVIMSAMASQITSISTVCSAACSVAHQTKRQSPALLTFVWGLWASKAENVSIWWRHHVLSLYRRLMWSVSYIYCHCSVRTRGNVIHSGAISNHYNCEVGRSSICILRSQKQVSRAGIVNYSLLWDVIAYACPRYLPLAPTSLYVWSSNKKEKMK